MGLSYIVCIVELSIPVGVDVWIASLIVLDKYTEPSKTKRNETNHQKVLLESPRTTPPPFPAPRSFHRIRKQTPKEREKKKRKQEKESKRSLFPTNFVVCAVFYDAVQEREEEKAKRKKKKEKRKNRSCPRLLYPCFYCLGQKAKLIAPDMSSFLHQQNSKLDPIDAGGGSPTKANLFLPGCVWYDMMWLETKPRKKVIRMQCMYGTNR